PAPLDVSQCAHSALEQLKPLQAYRSWFQSTTDPDPSQADDVTSSYEKAVAVFVKSLSTADAYLLQALIDCCHLVYVYRTTKREIHSLPMARRKLAEAILTAHDQPNKHSYSGHSHVSIEPARNAGYRLLVILSAMGSMAFLPVLFRAEAFKNIGAIRKVTAQTLTNLVYLLQGGMPDMETLKDDDKNLAEAGCFAAHAVLPRILAAVLVEAQNSLGEAIARGEEDLREGIYATTNLSGLPAHGRLPQPPQVHYALDGAQIAFGLMSGGGCPVTLPAASLLGKGYLNDKPIEVGQLFAKCPVQNPDPCTTPKQSAITAELNVRTER
ncbi:hypothetical protein OC834_007981, partial [Tilletia horrida]